MESEWMTDRARLRQLLHDHPTWRMRDFATVLKRSVGWVSKWINRLRSAPADDDTILQSRSRVPKTTTACLSLTVMLAIIMMRLHPPGHLRRTPGPVAILYYLGEDPALEGEYLPRSPRTVYRILKKAGLIPDRARRRRDPKDRPLPMAETEIDFTDIQTIIIYDHRKQSHIVEVFNIIDVGTSILLASIVRDDFNAETVLMAMVDLVKRIGVLKLVRFDRDPRFVGAPQGAFPSAFVRFWLCLGTTVDICEPECPQEKGFVERVQRTFKEECIAHDRPTTLEDAQRAADAFQKHDNEERPNQAMTCQNQPPNRAFPSLPALPPPPEMVDPDSWVDAVNGLRITRQVRSNGSISVEKHDYSVGTALRGQEIALTVDAATRSYRVEHQGQAVKQLRMKGLKRSGPIPFDQFVEQLRQEAVSEHRRLHQQGLRNGKLPAGRGGTNWTKTLKAAMERVRQEEGTKLPPGFSAAEAALPDDDDDGVIPF